MVAENSSSSGNSKSKWIPLEFLQKLPWDCPDPRPSAEALELAQKALDIMKQKALAPTNIVSSARRGSMGGIWMYFWDGSSYADLEFYNDGHVVLCFNTENEDENMDDEEENSENHRITDRWNTRNGKRTVEGYAVEPTAAGLKDAVCAILKRVDRGKTLRKPSSGKKPIDR